MVTAAVKLKDAYSLEGKLLSGKESAANAGDTGYTSFIMDGEDPMEEDMATHTSILAWEIP